MYGLHERIRKSLESGLFLLNINIQYDTINSMEGCETMAYTEAQNKATQKYIKNNYDRIMITVPKGERDKYKAYAKSKGISLNALFINLIEADIKKGE